MATKILIVDPLTLLGRELARCIEASPDLLVEIDYRHTSADDEHQIAELGAEPALVPPLDDPEDIGDSGIVIVTSDVETERTRLLEDLIVRHHEVAVIDLARLPGLAELTGQATGSTRITADRRHLRVAHPALVAAGAVIRAVARLGPQRGSVAAVDPVSTYGRDALEVLVHQAGRRMQGGIPDHDIGGHVLAFNQVAVESDTLTEEAADLALGCPLAVTRVLSGCFHGHLAHITIELEEPVDDPELRDALESASELVITDGPMGLDLVPDRDQILVTRPQLSPDRRLIAVTAMIDGLRIGGAVTAVEILRTMTVH